MDSKNLQARNHQQKTAKYDYENDTKRGITKRLLKKYKHNTTIYFIEKELNRQNKMRED